MGHLHLTTTGSLVHSIFQGQKGINRDFSKAVEVQLTSARSAGPTPHPQEAVGIFGSLAWQDRVIDITFMSDSLANQPPAPQASESFSDITQFQADVISSLSSQSDFSMLHAHPTLLDCDHTEGKASVDKTLPSYASWPPVLHREKVMDPTRPTGTMPLLTSLLLLLHTCLSVDWCLLTAVLPQGLGSC